MGEKYKANREGVWRGWGRVSISQEGGVGRGWGACSRHDSMAITWRFNVFLCFQIVLAFFVFLRFWKPENITWGICVFSRTKKAPTRHLRQHTEGFETFIG